MACPATNHREEKAAGIPDVWECRYFVCGSEERPDAYGHDELKDNKEFFDRWEGPRRDDDVYFISGGTDVNVKLRKSGESEPTIKLRTRRMTRDGFLLWHTEFVERLPAPAEVWKHVLEQLKIKISDEDDEKLLSASSEAPEVERVLRGAVPKPFCKETVKLRWRYIGPLGEVEVAKVTVSSITRYSVSFESKSVDTSGIRRIRGALGTGEQWDAESYVQRLTHWPE